MAASEAYARSFATSRARLDARVSLTNALLISSVSVLLSFGDGFHSFNRGKIESGIDEFLSTFSALCISFSIPFLAACVSCYRAFLFILLSLYNDIIVIML